MTVFALPPQVRRHGGFTLMEILVTVAIIAILASISLPLGEIVAKRNREQDLRTALRQIRTAIDAYKQAADEGRIVKDADDSGYPKSLEDMVRGIEDQRDPKKRRIYFLRRVPRDPFDFEPDKHAGDTWGKRSYASPPDDPRDGDDIYDVYSLAKGKGLNGIPYREW